MGLAGRSVDRGDQITMIAVPESGSTFEGWSGDCSGTD
ncbi:MAG: InlB B-repeat-containing protein, partial [Ilumatobacteraceae bacterium]